MAYTPTYSPGGATGGYTPVYNPHTDPNFNWTQNATPRQNPATINDIPGLKNALNQGAITHDEFIQRFAKLSNEPNNVARNTTGGFSPKNLGQAIRDVGVGSFRQIARGGAELGLGAQELLTHKPVIFKPSGANRYLLGSEPITSPQQQGINAAETHRVVPPLTTGGFHIKGTPITLTPTQTGLAQTLGKTLIDAAPFKGGLKMAKTDISGVKATTVAAKNTVSNVKTNTLLGKLNEVTAPKTLAPKPIVGAVGKNVSGGGAKLPISSAAKDLQNSVISKLPEANHAEANRLAQNIAKNAGTKTVEPAHIAEAYQYRNPSELNSLSLDNAVRGRAPIQQRALDVGVKGIDKSIPTLAKSIGEKYKALPKSSQDIVDSIKFRLAPEFGLADGIGMSNATQLQRMSALLDKVSSAKTEKAVWGELSKAKDNPNYLKPTPPKVPVIGVGKNVGKSTTALLGTQKPNETLVAPIKLESSQMKLKANVPDNTRGLTKSIKESNNFTPELRKQVASQYSVYSDAEAVSGTEKFLNQPFEQAHKDVLARLQSTDKPSKQLVNDSGTVMQILDAKGRTAEANTIHDFLAPVGTESGQTAQAFALLYRRSPDGIYRKAINDLNKSGVKVSDKLDKELQGLREDIRKTLPDTQERQIAVNKLRASVEKNLPSTVADKIYALWRGGLLTGVRTMSKVISSHAIHGTLEAIKEVPATAVDKFASLISHQRGVVLTQKGRLTGLKQGVKGSKEFLKTGIDTTSSNVDFHSSVYFGNSIPGKIANIYATGPGRLHGAVYNIAGRQAELNELYNMAIVNAKNAGLKGTAKTKFIEDFVAKPSLDATKAAKQAGDMAAFRQKTVLGDIATRLQHTDSPVWNMVAKIIAPFSRIPSAIGISGIINYSPIGAVKTIIQGIKAARSEEGWTVAAQREFSRGLGRSITGFGAIIPGMVLYNKGLMTLEYPKDAKEAKLWQEEGKTAWSVKVDGSWHSVGTLGPAGIVLAIGGGWAEGIKNGDSVVGGFGNGMFKGMLSVQEETYLAGVNSFVTAVQQGGAKVDSIAKQYAGSIIPTLVRNWASATDPNKRQVNTPAENIQAGIPYWRKGLPVKKGAFGENVPSAETGLKAFTDPFYSSKSINNNDPLIQELRRLQDSGNGIMPSTQYRKNTFNKVDTTLTSSQAQDLTSQIGAKLKDAWSKRITSSGYQNRTDEQKHQDLSNLSRKITTATKKEYARQHNLGK